jgi:hypothetical protein
MPSKVTLRRGKLTIIRWVHSAASYASQSEAVITFGLGPPPTRGKTPAPIEVEVLWPDTNVQRLGPLEPRKLQVLTEAP